jgi:uncharacterized iron-regulated membrane protein
MAAEMLRRALVALHRWLGLTMGTFLLVLGVTGLLLIFADQIDAALNPRLFQVTPRAQRRSLDEIARAAGRAWPGGRGVAEVRPADAPDRAHRVILRNGLEVFVDPYTARALGVRRRETSAMGYVRDLHTQLLGRLAGRLGAVAGRWLAGSAGLLLCLLIPIGLLLWLRYRLLSVRWREGAPAIVFDVHNIAGFYASLLLLLIAATGAALCFEGAVFPASERRWLLTLHSGDIYGWPTRILYAVVALILALQVVTGFAVWRRRRRAEAIGMPRGYVCEEQPPPGDPP